MSIRREPMSRMQRTAALVLAATLMLAARAGQAQPELSQPPQHDHGQHGPGQLPDEHAGHGDHSPAKPADQPEATPPAQAQTPPAHDNHGGHAPPPGPAGSKSKHAGHATAKSKGGQHAGHSKSKGSQHAGHAGAKSRSGQHAGHAGTKSGSQQHTGAHTSADHGMKGFLGPYGMTREGSGTSWLPDTTPHEGIHGRSGEWTTMWHALINGVYDQQGGPRGGQKTFAGGMIMGMAQRAMGDGTVGVRAMLSPDPFMGPAGYPLLLATGETADGRTHLVDRQHPHDLFMELAATYSYTLSSTSSVFLYAGWPGEPALGPTAFMHRTSGMDIPEAPISHHWLDSTHITFGVLTAGLVVDKWKVEASAFRGREPDQHRFDLESPRFDSFAARVTWNPIRELSMQVSAGRLHSPELLAPNVDEDRITASATYTLPFGDGNLWSSTLAWGRKMRRPGDRLDGFLLESALMFQKTYTLFARAERVDENELFHDVPGFDTRIFTVNKLTLGGIYDFPVQDQVKFGVGGLVSMYGLPNEIKPFYGHDPISYMLFARIKVQ
ncbi:MAG: hypothetical protein QOI12_5092 [Alphaproteobacteria bacterium]|nr:hypothetical protein [Alphaproteobacteria bacterium]